MNVSKELSAFTHVLFISLLLFGLLSTFFHKTVWKTITNVYNFPLKKSKYLYTINTLTFLIKLLTKGF